MEFKYPWYIKLFFYFQKKKFGTVLPPTKMWATMPKALFLFTSLFKRLKKNQIPEEIQALCSILVSQINECAFCVDFNSYLILEKKDITEKIEEIQNYKESNKFTEQEKTSLLYAEEITNNQVTDETRKQLTNYYTEKEIVELTALIAFQNMSSKFNNALNVSSAALCKIN